MIKKILFLLLLTSNLFATTYYISPTGNDGTGDGSTATPWLTLNKAFSTMSGGDTLIVKDGTYTGALNIITNAQYPPIGSTTTYTTVRAEHDGLAIFDGQNARSPINCIFTSTTSVYWNFEGLLFNNASASCVTLIKVQYAKFIRCGAYDSADGNNINFNISHNCKYVLLENCYSYGNSRYSFLVYQSSNVIVRNCVGRLDSCNPSDPIGGYSMYSVLDCDVQNSIAIDFDQLASYQNVTNYNGGFLCPATDMHGENINFVNCLGLNIKTGMVTMAAQYRSDNVTLTNCSFIDNYSVGTTYLGSLRSINTVFDRCTIVNSSTSYRVFGNGDLDSSLFIHFKNTLMNRVFSNTNGNFYTGVASHTYNSYWAVSSTPTLQTGETKTINNLWSSGNTDGALKYLPRVEAGSNLSAQGEGGVDIGANSLTLIGSTGTLSGDEGYNTDTGIETYPIASEALIRHKMKTYDERGFCDNAKQLDGSHARTLTSYIWEYLGNQMPTGLYNSTSTISADVVSGFTGTTVTFTLGITSGTITQGYVDYGDGNSEVIYSTASTVSHTYDTAGSYIASWASDSSVGATNPEALDITITTAPEPAPVFTGDRIGIGNAVLRNVILR